MLRLRFLFINSLLLFAVLASYGGRSIEDARVQEADFLSKLNLQFRGWPSKNLELDRSEMELLDPDAVLVKRFTSPDDGFAELAVVAGHRKKTVHTPGFCMAGGGWQLVSQSETKLKVAGRDIPAIRAIMVKEGERLLITYFFTDGSYATTSLPQFMFSQTLKRLRAKVPVGALVRVIVPVTSDSDSGYTLTQEFAEQTLPPVLAALRSVKLIIE